MALAEVVQEAQEPSSEVLSGEALLRLEVRIKDLKDKVTEGLLNQGIKSAAIQHETFLNLRYQGTETNFMISAPRDGNWRSAFEKEHLRDLSFIFPEDRNVLVDDVRVRGVGKSNEVSKGNEELVHELKTSAFSQAEGLEDKVVGGLAISTGRYTDVSQTNAYFAEGKLQPTKVLRLDSLSPGSVVDGPAIIIDSTQTIVVTPDAQAHILSSHVVIDLLSNKAQQDLLEHELVVDPIKLSIFGHRFMSIAEQMGRTLQKTSLSLNIKERLDFSCAIFSPDGELVANAPYVRFKA
jgi:5-oxoprolinase (ATP-hydrolysing)